MHAMILVFALSVTEAQHVPIVTRWGVTYAEFCPEARPCRLNAKALMKALAAA